MESVQLVNNPLVTECCRVERLYTGGALLDRWQGMGTEKDGSMSEEYLLSTSEYMGPGHPPENGLSRIALPDGGYETLVSLIQKNQAGFLGELYQETTRGHSGVLVRAGDSTVRLVIQCHPTEEKARTVLGIPFGKTEAWYIAETRRVNGEAPHLYCGFRKGVNREKWKTLLETQDVDGMLACMYKFEIQKGDCILIPAGMPHAMGPGALFVEVHEPCDYTIRMEKHYAVRSLSDEEMHYGLGFDALLDFFDYTTYSQAEIEKKCIMRPKLVREEQGGCQYDLITYAENERFEMKKLTVTGSFEPSAFDGHFGIITVRNGVRLVWKHGEMDVPQGRGIFVPAKVEGLRLEGEADVLLAYPFQIAKAGVS